MWLSTNGGSSSKAYVDDLFSVQLRTGNGSTQNIATGFQPDMVWTKSRSAATGHRIVDSLRGVGNSLETNSAAAQTSETTGLTAFNPTGYSVGADTDYNTASATYVDWVWKKAPKFFDIVTYTGNGVAGRQIPHSLGIAPGIVTTKSTSTAGDWNTYHRSATGDLKLNLTNAQTASRALVTAASDGTFTVSGLANSTGVTYVAYLFAHDDSADGIIQCGSFTTDASGNATVELGWEPQFLIHKPINNPEGWYMHDTMRGLSHGEAQFIYANSANQEGKLSGAYLVPISGGFTTPNVGYLTPSKTFIYLAIRRPNKPPTSGTEVYNAIARTGTGAAATVTGVGFAPDLVLAKPRTPPGYSGSFFDRLRGRGKVLVPNAALSEASEATTLTAFGNDSFSLGIDANSLGVNTGGSPTVYECFRRALGFMDVVCYTGTGAAGTVTHGLSVVPELLISKTRSGIATRWYVYHAALGATKFLGLNETRAANTATPVWNNTAPTATVFSVGDGDTGTTDTHVAYLFASMPGIQKITSFVGNGTTQSIDCGFSAGARFVCIKAVSTTGNWNVGDSTRGITAGTDGLLCLNTTGSEVITDDWLDPYAPGFTVNETSSAHANTAGVTYLVWAIA